MAGPESGPDDAGDRILSTAVPKLNEEELCRVEAYKASHQLIPGRKFSTLIEEAEIGLPLKKKFTIF